MHAEARGASGRYTQEKSAEVYLWPKPVEAGILDRGKKRRKMQTDAKRCKKMQKDKKKEFFFVKESWMRWAFWFEIEKLVETYSPFGSVHAE